MKTEENINISIGERLKMIREIYNEGSKISTTQFAYLLDLTRDQLANYECGRSSLPVNVIYNLYKRGINPTFLIAGEENMFANNFAGTELKNKIEHKISVRQNAKIKGRIYEGRKLKVAAGLLEDES